MAEADFRLGEADMERLIQGRSGSGASSLNDPSRWRDRYEYSLLLARRQAQAEGRAEGRAHGEAAAMKNAICRLCELVGVPLDAERRAQLDETEGAELLRVLDAIVLEQRWPL